MVDKGALDALGSDDSPEAGVAMMQYLDEMQRVLVQNGVFLCITLAQAFTLSESSLSHMPLPWSCWLLAACLAISTLTS